MFRRSRFFLESFSWANPISLVSIESVRMALKKSELYSSLWSSCDELRGGMDASQYKDYARVLLFIKYVSDKYAGQPFAPIKIPDGASFKDMVALKGKADIGDQINKRIVAPWPARTSCRICPTSTMPPSSVRARRWSID